MRPNNLSEEAESPDGSLRRFDKRIQSVGKAKVPMLSKPSNTHIKISEKQVDITKSLPLAILKPIAQNITIYIGTLTGRKFSIECLSTDTVHFLKKRILEEERIAINAQILVFREKPLQKDSDTLGSLGIQNFSTIQLLIHMHGGPGVPVNTRVAPRPQNAILLLCKQNSEYFVVDIRLKDADNMSPLERFENIRSSFKDGSIIENLGNVEFVDIVDLDEIPPTILDDYEEIEEEFRPKSSGSSISTCTFLSFATESAMGSANSEDLYQVYTDSEWMESFKNTCLSSPIEKAINARPATAISLMRLPHGARPMIVIPKSRPSTAKDINIIEDARKMNINGAAIEIDVVEDAIIEDAVEIIQTKAKLKEAKKSLIPQKKVKERVECKQCKKRLGPAQVFMCKCRMEFCAEHRYWDRHSCLQEKRKRGQ